MIFMIMQRRLVDQNRDTGRSHDYGTFFAAQQQNTRTGRCTHRSGRCNAPEANSDAQKVGDFYRSYTILELRNQAGTRQIEPLLGQIRELDRMPSWVRCWQLSCAVVSVDPLLRFVSPDARKSDQYAVYVSQSGLSLPDRDYYLQDEERYVTLRTKLQSYIEDMLQAIHVDNPAEDSEKHS